MARSPYYAGYDESDDLAEQASDQAGRYFSNATKPQKATFDAAVARNSIMNWPLSPVWTRTRDEAKAAWYVATAEARVLYDRTMVELLASGEITDELSEAWTALERCDPVIEHAVSTLEAGWDHRRKLVAAE